MRLDLAQLPYLSRSSVLATTKWIAVLAAAGWGLAGCGGDDDSPAAATPAQDVATAKALFSNLRSNATALQSGATDTGISNGVKALGSSLQTDAVSASTAVADSIGLDQMAFALWQAYKLSGTTTNPNSSNTATLAGCTVFRGAFPPNLGPFTPLVPTSFVPTSVVATSAANAAWVGCSKDSQPSLPRYRQTKIYDMGGATAAGTYPGSVPYLAVTRSEFFEAGVRKQLNLTVPYAGVVGMAGLKGDLPPLTDSAGKLLADHYTADLSSSTVTLASGAQQTTLTKGRFTAVPIAGSTAGTLTVDLSNAAAGTSSLVLPNDSAVPAQLAAAQASLFATVSNATGTLTGNIVADRYLRNVADGTVFPGHAKFVGTASVVPKGTGVTATSEVKFLDGTLELTDVLPAVGANRTLTFSGLLTLPQRPQAALEVAVTEPSVQGNATATTESFSGKYTQGTLTVNFSGTRTPTETSATFSDSSGVATTIKSTTSRSNVTVGGRQTAVIDKSAGTIVYSDGTTESLP